jgi:hypothetical protein
MVIHIHNIIIPMELLHQTQMGLLDLYVQDQDQWGIMTMTLVIMMVDFVVQVELGVIEVFLIH